MPTEGRAVSNRPGAKGPQPGCPQAPWPPSSEACAPRPCGGGGREKGQRGLGFQRAPGVAPCTADVVCVGFRNLSFELRICQEGNIQANSPLWPSPGKPLSPAQGGGAGVGVAGAACTGMLHTHMSRRHSSALLLRRAICKDLGGICPLLPEDCASWVTHVSVGTAHLGCFRVS